MKKYAFRLEQVRRVRSVQEQLAKNALASANSAVQQSAQNVANRLEEYNNSLSTAGLGVNGTGDFLKARHFADLSGSAVVSALQAKLAAEAEASAKRSAYAEAAQRLKALERLDARRREEFAIEYERDIEKEVNDIVVSRHLPNSRRGS